MEKVLIIGLDEATQDLIKPWADKRVVQYGKKLKKEMG